MLRWYSIGLDTHSRTVEMAAQSPSGQKVRRDRCSTTIPAILAMVQAVPKPRRIALEEGPLADWLWRSLREHGETVTVCDPRRNRLIAADSDKDDPIDAAKLANLLRGGYLKEVHHPASLERAVFKQHVGLYRDRVRQRVREANRIIALLRRHGVVVRERAFADPAKRAELVERLPASKLLRADMQLLWKSYDGMVHREAWMRRRLVRRAREEEVIRRWTTLPGIGWVRAATLFVYWDAPGRFPGKSALWRYSGIGLERRQSGSGPERVRLSPRVNRILKDVLIGAARVAVRSESNPFAGRYQEWRTSGMASPEAVRNVARMLAATAWGMWKNGSAYRPEWVGVAAAAMAFAAGSKERDGCDSSGRRSSLGGTGRPATASPRT